MGELPSFVTTALLALARSYMKQQPTQVLSEYGEDYLERWILDKDRLTGSVYIHRILRSDYDEELHDHPGDNLSIVLHGTMVEITEDGERLLFPGSVIHRRADERHRLRLTEPVTTIWIMGERIREWGFWDKSGNFTPSQQFFADRAKISSSKSLV